MLLIVVSLFPLKHWKLSFCEFIQSILYPSPVISIIILYNHSHPLYPANSIQCKFKTEPCTQCKCFALAMVSHQKSFSWWKNRLVAKLPYLPTIRKKGWLFQISDINLLNFSRMVFFGCLTWLIGYSIWFLTSIGRVDNLLYCCVSRLQPMVKIIVR